MKRILMRSTERTRCGVLREGKPYPVPDDLADELVAAGLATDLEKPIPERAVLGPTEDAARVSKRPTKTTRTKKEVSTDE